MNGLNLWEKLDKRKVTNIHDSVNNEQCWNNLGQHCSDDFDHRAVQKSEPKMYEKCVAQGL